MKESKENGGWRLFYQKPVGLDLEWTNGEP